MELDSKYLVKLLRDPVMAAEVIIGIRLDIFQQARLRYLWFVQHKIDDSGWSTGKTICEWVYAVLRACLIPDQRVGVYYQVFQAGKDEFWKYFSEFDTDLLRAQYIDGPQNEWHDPACYRKEFKNGSMIQLPAPGFMKDARSQASRRFNTLIIGEYTQVALEGDGIDELFGRNTRASWNQAHPIWGNHTLLSAHAEPPSHPSRTFARAMKAQIAGKHKAREIHQNAIISFCYRDWTDKPVNPKNPEYTFKKAFLNESAIQRSLRTLSKAQMRCRLLGISVADDRGWYTEELLSKLLTSQVMPMVERTSGDNAYYVLGGDAAPSAGIKSDSCFVCVIRVEERKASQFWNWFDGARYWLVAPVYAHTFKDVRSTQYSGLIHGLRMRFGLSYVVLDPGGGGGWVYKDLLEPVQTINNIPMRVVPICTRDEPFQADKQPIVVMFKRRCELDPLWSNHYQASDEGIIEAAHRMCKEHMEAREIAWPQLLTNRSFGDRASMSEAQRLAQMNLDVIYRQLTMVSELVDEDGKPILTSRRFKKFGSKIKKDGAYSFVYAMCGVKLLLTGPMAMVSEEDDGVEYT